MAEPWDARTGSVPRRARVGAEVAHALARLIERRCADPRLKLVTVTEVSMSPDLKRARVWASSADPAADPEAALAALRHAGTRLRHDLAREIRLRTMPRLDFVWDRSGESRARLDTLIAQGLPKERGSGLGTRDSGTRAAKPGCARIENVAPVEVAVPAANPETEQTRSGSGGGS